MGSQAGERVRRRNRNTAAACVREMSLVMNPNGQRPAWRRDATPEGKRGRAVCRNPNQSLDIQIHLCKTRCFSQSLFGLEGPLLFTDGTKARPHRSLVCENATRAETPFPAAAAAAAASPSQRREVRRQAAQERRRVHRRPPPPLNILDAKCQQSAAG